MTDYVTQSIIEYGQPDDRNRVIKKVQGQVISSEYSEHCVRMSW